MPKLLKISLTFIIFLVFAGDVFPQDGFQLAFEIIDEKGESKLEKPIKTDSAFVEKIISQRLNQLYYEGYLSAFQLEYSAKGNAITSKLQKGQLYQLRKLSSGNIDPAILEGTGYKEFPGVLNSYYLENLFNKVLDYAENNGYPFAIVKLDSIKFYDDGITASLNLFRGPKITFNLLEIDGYNKLKLEWLENYLGIKEGFDFSEKAIKNIEKKIRDLAFVELNKPVEVRFSPTSAIVKIFLKEKKINNVDGIIGFLPNQRDNTKMLVNGSFNLHLYNLFSSAKQLHIDWQKVNVNSQTLNTSIYYPQLLKMPLGLSFDFNFLKEDTLYLNRYALLKIYFTPRPGQKIFFNTEFENSDLLGQESNEQNSFNDYKINYYGISYLINSLDDDILPTSGSFFKIDAYTGTKKFDEEIVEDETENTEEVKSTQYKMEARFDHYFLIKKGYQVKLKVKSGNLFGNNLFKNDMFRIGGLKSLRGFNENYFFVSDYVYSNLEFRLMQSANTYFFVFYDQGIIKDKTSQQDIDFPIGTGIGLNLGTNSGLFSLVIGMGKSQTQNFSLNSAKIHFGYLGRF